MEKKLAKEGENNTKTFANYIKSKTKAQTGIGPLKEPNGTLITDDKAMSETLTNSSPVCSQMRTLQIFPYVVSNLKLD